MEAVPGHRPVSGAEEAWRLLPYDRGSSLDHFARSDALARLVETPSVWWHSTDRPTLILGAGQRLQDVAAACAASGVLVVKRQAGGTSVFASTGVLGLDIALPTSHSLVTPDVVEGYRWLGEIWLRTMLALNVPAHLVSVEEARATPSPRGTVVEALRAACFGTVSPYEILTQGRKLVGLAQVRRRAGALLQSGLHLHFDAHRLAGILMPDQQEDLAAALREVASGFDEVAPLSISGEDVIGEFGRQLEQWLGVRLVPSEWTGAEVAHAGQYAHEPSR